MSSGEGAIAEDFPMAQKFRWLCILFVYRIGSQMDSLSVTLVVTLRKFLSLLVSIYFFRNTFTTTHWLGAVLVFGGTLLFSLKR